MILLTALASILELPREDGSTITAYLDVPNDSKNVVLVVNGSDIGSCYQFHEKAKESFGKHGIGVCSIEKRGMTREKQDLKEFWTHACFESRLQDHLAIYQHLEREYNVLVLGGSEGGETAAALGHMTQPVAVCLLCTGGGWIIKDEMKWCFLKQSPRWLSWIYGWSYVFGWKIDYDFSKTVSDPDPNKFGYGYSYKWWASHLNRHILKDIQKIQCPILYVHGTTDDMVPIESADLVAEFMKPHTDFTYRRLDNAGHQVWKKDEDNIIGWVKEQFERGRK